MVFILPRETQRVNVILLIYAVLTTILIYQVLQWNIAPRYDLYEGEKPSTEYFSTKVMNDRMKNAMDQSNLSNDGLPDMNATIPIESTESIESRQPLNQLQGWWNDVQHCQGTGQLNIYCKPSNEWIFPY